MNGELGLGRLIQPDARSALYTPRQVLQAEGVLDVPLEELGNPKKPGTKFWNDALGWHEQGPTGQCVGYGTANWLEDAPVQHPNWDPDGHELYCEIVKRDVWPANDACDVQFGTSVLAAGLYLRSLGIVKSFLWADPSTDDAYRWLLTMGPLLVGFSWYRSMWDMRREQNALGEDRWYIAVDPSQGYDGGHCFQINGVDVHGEDVRCKLGSWGRDVYVDGRVRMHMRDFELLHRDFGEVMMASEVRGTAEEAL